jgi:hypothetical protein
MAMPTSCAPALDWCQTISARVVMRSARSGRLENRVEVVLDLRSTSGRRSVAEGTAAAGPAPKDGTADSASAKVPSAAWPRCAPERPPQGHKAPRDLPEL